MFEKYLTFDDVLLLPNYSEILPSEANTSCRLTKKINLKAPFVSAAMDTVTESKMAIEMAKNGGIGIIHKNMTIEQQVAEVKKVKTYHEVINYEPFYVYDNTPIQDAIEIMDYNDISSVIVVDSSDRVCGILTRKDLRFITAHNEQVCTVMTTTVQTLNENVSYEEAKSKIHELKLTKMPVVDVEGRLIGLVTLKDLSSIDSFVNKVVDDNGKLLCGAAVSVNEESINKIQKLVNAGADVIVIDSAHGHSKSVIELAREVKDTFDIQLIVGNIVTKEAVAALSFVDAVKVGVGSGSICTTRIISGVGAPQLSALLQCVTEAKKYNLPVIADGGIRYSGDVVKALAAGADTIMLGSILAGHDQSPGEVIIVNDQKFKSYVGMGSMVAMTRGGGDRYFQSKVKKFVPEGVEALKPYKGNVNDTLYQIIGGLKSGMGYNGAKTLQDLHSNANFVEITSAGMAESHPHSITNVSKSPNYDN